MKRESCIDDDYTDGGFDGDSGDLVFDNIDDAIAFAAVEEARERNADFVGSRHGSGCGCMSSVAVLILVAVFILTTLR